jgi:hypothetical protein
MPRLYLHLRMGDALVEDPDGAEFASVETARGEAIAAARELMSEQMRHGVLPDLNSCFEITDVDRRLVLAISFNEAVGR